MLYVGGFLARSAYELEMAAIRKRWDDNSSSKTPEEQIALDCSTNALHVLRFFTFRTSTPSPAVSNEIRKAFFSCANQGLPFPIVSSVGIRDARDVRVPDPMFFGFLKQLPVVPQAFIADSKLMVIALREQGMLKEISHSDVFRQLSLKPLSEDEMVFCLKWWITVAKKETQSNLQSIRKQFLDVASVTTESFGQQEQRLLPFSAIKTILDPHVQVIPTDGPLPEHLLPIAIAKEFDKDSLLKAFPWTELTISTWIEHISDKAVCEKNAEFDLTTSATWAEKVLGVLAQAWSNLLESDKTKVTNHLKGVACIPTSAGMKAPQESYFSDADIFHDLPVVTFPSGDQRRPLVVELLGGLGVRKHIDMQLIFDR